MYAHPTRAHAPTVAALPPLNPMTAEPKAADAAPQPARKASMPGVGTDVAVFERSLLGPGMEIQGPCLVEEVDTSFFLLKGAIGRVDVFANLIVTVK